MVIDIKYFGTPLLWYSNYTLIQNTFIFIIHEYIEHMKQILAVIITSILLFSTISTIPTNVVIDIDEQAIYDKISRITSHSYQISNNIMMM
jgi:hypothetical protein